MATVKIQQLVDTQPDNTASPDVSLVTQTRADVGGQWTTTSEEVMTPGTNYTKTVDTNNRVIIR